MYGDDGRARCSWGASDPEYRRYHDEEWGTPLHGDRELFEKMSLEGFQAGLSWITILRRRPAFREAFHDFDPELIAGFDQSKVEALMQNAAIIRNRAKIEATISNARLVLQLSRENPGALDELLWNFAPHAGQRPRPAAFDEVPAVTPESTAMSKALRSAGFRFVGPTTMYALMQSTGMVDDHLLGCWRAG
ncbi:MAG: DNA-3-methyladenine glycosylase I [Lacisediminihabitans sp.]